MPRRKTRLDPKEIRYRHQRRADDEQPCRAIHEIGECHQRDAANQRHDGALLPAVDEEAQSDRTEQQPPPQHRCVQGHLADISLDRHRTPTAPGARHSAGRRRKVGGSCPGRGPNRSPARPPWTNQGDIMKFIGFVAFASGCLLVLPLALTAAGTAPAFQLSDLQKIVRLSEPQISPDGKRVAVIVSTPDVKTDKSQQEIDLVDVASGARRPLTWKREELGSPRWSPDGSRLAFIARDAKSKEGQLYVMPMDGGDAIRITETKHGVDSFSWSPDGRQLAFVSADEAPNAKAIKAHDDAFQVTDNHFLTRAALTPSHLWVVSSAGGTARRLTEGSFSLQTDQQDSAPEPAWSRDGQHIAFVRFPGPYWGPSFHSVIDAVDTAGGAPRTLVTAQTVMEPRYAPRGSALAFTRPRGGDQNNGNAVYVSIDGHDRDVTQALARHFNNYAWLPNGKALLLAGGEGTHAVLWRQPLSGQASKLDLGDVEAGADISVANTGALAFIGSTTTHPGELYVMNSVKIGRAHV